VLVGEHAGEPFGDVAAAVIADPEGQILACPSCSANAGIAEAARRRLQQA
jgi:hypothetical protein